MGSTRQIDDLSVGQLARLLEEPGRVSDEERCEALGRAVVQGDLKRLRLLLKHGADPNRVPRGRFWSAMHVAVEEQRPEILTELLEAGGEVNLVDHQGFTPLHLAIDIETDAAAQAGVQPVPALTEVLLRFGASQDVLDDSGRTPQDIALESDHREALTLLRRFRKEE